MLFLQEHEVLERFLLLGVAEGVGCDRLHHLLIVQLL
jgi:hypothetical protein